MATARTFSLLLTVVAISATTVAVASDMVDRKLLQTPRVTQNQCGPPNAVYVGDDDDSCRKCAQRRNTIAWCCRSDDTASPTECKRAGPKCCEGPEYKYIEQEMDDGKIETDEEDLDDVWCVPSTCRDNFQPPQLRAAGGPRRNTGR